MLRLIILRFLETYFRRRWLYLAPILILLLAAGVYFAFKDPTYASRGVLSIQRESLLAKLTSVQGTDFSWETPSTATVKEIYELSQTDSFLRAVIQKTDLESKMSGGKEEVLKTIEDVRTALTASTLGDTQVTIEAEDDKPEIAYQLVSSVIDTFVQWKINADLSDSHAAVKFFSDQRAKLQTDVDLARQELYSYMESHPAPVKGERLGIEQLEIDRLETGLDQAIARYSQTLDDLENAQLASAQAESNVRQSYMVIDSPQVSEKPEVTNKEIALQLAVFIAIGVLLSVIAITGAALLDRTFRFPIDVWHGVNLPVLTQVPDMTPAKKSSRKQKRLAEPAPALIESEMEFVELDELAVSDESMQDWQGIHLPLLAQVPETDENGTVIDLAVEERQPVNRMGE